MGIREEAEAFGITIFSMPHTGLVGAIAAWSWGALRSLKELSLQDQEQFQSALEIIEAWGMVLPHTLNSQGSVVTYSQENVASLRKLFESTRRIAERLAAIEIREFCDTELREIGRLSQIGDMTCETWVLDKLIDHHKQMLAVVLGNSLFDRFVENYDQAM